MKRRGQSGDDPEIKIHQRITVEIFAKDKSSTTISAALAEQFNLRWDPQTECSNQRSLDLLAHLLEYNEIGAHIHFDIETCLDVFQALPKYPYLYTQEVCQFILNHLKSEEDWSDLFERRHILCSIQSNVCLEALVSELNLRHPLQINLKAACRRAIEVPLSLLLQHCRKLSVDSVVGSHPLIIQTEFDLNVLELAVEFMVAGRFHAVITTDNWVNLVHFSSKYGYRELFVTAFAYQNLEGHSNGVIANNIFDVPSLYDVARDAHRTHLQSWSNGDCIPFCLKPTRVSWVSTDLLKTELAVYFSKNTFAMINSYEDPKSTELMLEFFNSKNIENITDTKLMEGLMTAAVHFEHEELYLKSYFALINLGCDWSKFPKIFYHQLAPDEALKCLRDGSSVFVTLVGEDGSKLKGHKETLARRLRFIFDLLHTFTDTIEIPFPVPCAKYDVLQRFIEFSSTDSFPYSDGKGWFQRVTLLLNSVYFADFILYDELLKRAFRHLSDFLNHHNAEKIYECLPIANSSLTVLEFMNKIQQKFLGQVYKSNTFLLREPENFIFALGQCQDSLLRDRVYDHWTDHNREALMTRRFTVKSVFRDPYFKGVNISHLLNYLESRKTRFGNLEQLVRCLMPIESSDNQLKRVEFSSAVNLREIPGLSITLCARSYDHNSANFLNFNCYDNQFKLSLRICQRYESRDCVNIPPKGYWKEGTMMVILRFPSFYKICGQSCEESMDSYTNGHSEKRFVFWPFCGQVIACVRTENGDNNIFLLDIPSSKWRNVSREIYPQPLKGQSLVVNDRLYFLNAGDWIVLHFLADHGYYFGFLKFPVDRLSGLPNIP